MAERRSSPNFKRSMGDLYPGSLDSDPKELAKQVSDLFTQHARAHDRNVTHAQSFHERLVQVEAGVERSEELMGDTKNKLTEEMDELKDTVTNGFADVKLYHAVQDTKFKTAVAIFGVVWAVLSVVGTAAYQYVTKPTCKPDEALVSGSCVPVTVVVKK